MEHAWYHSSCCVFSIMAEQMVMNSSDLDTQACPTLMIMCVMQVLLSSDAICWLKLLIARYYAVVHIALSVTAWSIETFLHAGCQRTSHMVTKLILRNSPSCTWEVVTGHSLQKALVVDHSILILHDRNKPYCQPDFWVVVVLWLGGYGPSTEKVWSHSHIFPVSLNCLWSIWLTSDFHYMPVWSKLTSGCRHVTTLTLVCSLPKYKPFCYSGTNA
jgi:hypothetical protein